MAQFEASIIVPVLNQVDGWLRQAVESAARQTAPAEVVVITSVKTSPSNHGVLDQLCRTHPNIQVYQGPPESGFAASLNFGIRKASGRRIGLLMSDDWLDPRAIESSVVFPEDIVSTGRTFFAADGITCLTELAQEHTERAWRAQRKPADQANFLGHFLLFQRDALDRAGGVDETLGDSPGVDDFDLVWCLLERNATVRIVPQALYNYRDHEGQRLTRRKYAAMEATFNRILDKHGVHGRERQRIFAEHSFWFGASMWTRYRELAPERTPGPLKGRLQNLYRKALPLRHRIAIHAALRRGGPARPSSPERL